MSTAKLPLASPFCAVSGVAAPVFDTVDFTAAGSDTVLVPFNHCRNLFTLVRMNDENDFVVTHAYSFWTLKICPPQRQVRCGKKKTLNSSITILFIAIVWMVLFLKSFLEEMEKIF